jgi:hypothetical protein
MERRVKQRSVAEQSVGVFARPASTPTGYSSFPLEKETKDEKESWPGKKDLIDPRPTCSS